VELFLFVVDLDERGEFRAHVEAEDGTTVYELQSDPDGELHEIEDGVMEDKDDLDGLEEHLQNLKIIPKHSRITDDEGEFYDPDADEEDEEEDDEEEELFPDRD